MLAVSVVRIGRLQRDPRCLASPGTADFSVCAATTRDVADSRTSFAMTARVETATAPPLAAQAQSHHGEIGTATGPRSRWEGATTRGARPTATQPALPIRGGDHDGDVAAGNVCACGTRRNE